MSQSEELREALLNQQRALDREAKLRVESESLLAGLRVLVFSQDPKEMFHQLFDVLQSVLDFENAFVLVEESRDTFIVESATIELFKGTVWKPQELFHRVFTGTTVAVFDVAEVPEWIAQSAHIREGTGSALHMFLSGAERKALLVCTHSKKWHFTQAHLSTARRFSMLAAEALRKFRTEAELAITHQHLVEAAWQAGMAETAISVLHNVGNVLNSVNVSSSLAAKAIQDMKISSLEKLSDLLTAHSSDLGSFLSEDPQGRQTLFFLRALFDQLAQQQHTALHELNSLQMNMDHIKVIISLQQSNAQAKGLLETVAVHQLVEDALRICSVSLKRHGVYIHRLYEDCPLICVDRHKVLQILVNLLTNAKNALREREGEEKSISLRLTSDASVLKIEVKDNGVGIAPETLDKLFTYGFTTRKDGHGFGLHSSALAAKSMGGGISIKSEGLGKGAICILELPLHQANQIGEDL